MAEKSADCPKATPPHVLSVGPFLFYVPMILGAMCGCFSIFVFGFAFCHLTHLIVATCQMYFVLIKLASFSRRRCGRSCKMHTTPLIRLHHQYCVSPSMCVRARVCVYMCQFHGCYNHIFHSHHSHHSIIVTCVTSMPHHMHTQNNTNATGRVCRSIHGFIVVYHMSTSYTEMNTQSILHILRHTLNTNIILSLSLSLSKTYTHTHKFYKNYSNALSCTIHTHTHTLLHTFNRHGSLTTQAQCRNLPNTDITKYCIKFTFFYLLPPPNHPPTRKPHLHHATTNHYCQSPKTPP